jgi:hypothetical protein
MVAKNGVDILETCLSFAQAESEIKFDTSAIFHFDALYR